MSEAVATDGLAAIPGVVRWLTALVFVIALPLFLILGNVLEVAGDRDFYLTEFEKYDVDGVTGFDRLQLRIIADRFIAYLQDKAPDLHLQVSVNGNQRELFNDRELVHMDDVHKLFRLVRNARLVAGAILILVPLAGLPLVGNVILARVGTLLVIGGIVTIALLATAGLLSLVDFSEAFVKFHQMAFSNDLWMLDPRTDYLVMLYPEGFWLDATLRIAMLSAVEAVVAGGVGLALAYFGVRR
ncbi:MAG: TIGR01906 family membrane protein [Chloroflexota bacterium]